MQLNQFYFQDTFYNGLTSGLLADVFSAQQTLNKIIKQCERLGCKQDCGCTGLKFTDITSGTKDCGCHG
jgi:hypothetical protein